MNYEDDPNKTNKWHIMIRFGNYNIYFNCCHGLVNNFHNLRTTDNP
jgi:hypothetical protein